MTPLTLLFDLDGTLLDTNIAVFVPTYFQALAKHLNHYVAPELMVRTLMSSTALMYNSADPAHTLQEVFEADFYPKLGVPKTELLEIIDDFYDHVFPALGELAARQQPDALPLIEWAFERGYRIAIATDPLFPRKATYHRLRWAGLDPEQFELVSTFENFHFTKTHSAYYAEVLGQLGWPDGPVLMVGNDIQRDLSPANKIGLKTYFIEGEADIRPGFEAGRGKLGDLQSWLDSIDLSTLEPSYKSHEAILGILSSTPAALHTLLEPLSSEGWRHAPTRADWAMNELVCHLRDTEREIHALQLKLMLERLDAFIPRPDTSVWASEREYLNVNGAEALQEFVAARLEMLGILRNLAEDVWLRKARHAIFGPTNFREVMGFIANHDQMHVQQAWKTLKKL